MHADTTADASSGTTILILMPQFCLVIAQIATLEDDRFWPVTDSTAEGSTSAFHNVEACYG